MDQAGINGAMSQHDRWLEALDPGYAEVDARSFAELLEFALRFGRLINYYDLSDEIDGDWAAFFAHDPSMILAAILAVNLAKREANFLALERQTSAARGDRKFELLCDLFAAVAALAREINGWLEALGPNAQSQAAALLRQQLVAAINGGLADALRRLIGYAEGAARPEALGQAIPLDIAEFLPIWDLYCDCPDPSIYQGGSRNRKIDHAWPYLATLFFTFLDAMSQLQAFARSNLDASLEQAGHQPHIALYMAFARLFRTAQDSINNISERYIRFYYHDILREDFRAAVPDRVYLTFTRAPDPGSTGSTIARGTLFSAGRDSNGADILYAADKNLLVGAAGIAKLRTLRVVPEAQIHQPALRIFATDIIIPKAVAAGAPPSWNTFGTAEIGKNPAEVTTPARLGFAISSPCLLLSGGMRRVTLTLCCSNAPPPDTWPLLTNAFDLFISTAQGWLPIDEYEASLDDSVLTLKLDLPPAAPAVAAFGPAAHTPGSGPVAPPAKGAAGDGANPDPTLPTLKAYLRQEGPLSSLASLELTGWKIETTVTSLAGLQLANTNGAVDPSKPFPLLGAPPALGSFSEIRQPELFAKTLSSLTITINWFNLPPNPDGFKGWYRDYTIGLDGKAVPDLFDNTRFKVGICVENPIRWYITDPASCTDSKTCLFRTHSDIPAVPDCSHTLRDGRLCASTVFHLEPLAGTPPPAYYDVDNSAIRIQLTAPDYAFGDVLYAQNVLSAVIQDLPKPDAGGQKVLSDAAQWIAACLSNCADSEDYQDCMTKCLQACMQQMVQTAISHLLDSLAESRQALGDAKILQWRTELLGLEESVSAAPPAKGIRYWFSRSAGLPNDPPPVRAQKLLDWIKLQQSDPTLPAALAESLQRCVMLLDAVQCIAECQNTANKSQIIYKESITRCLTNCMTKLQAPVPNVQKDLKYPNPPWLPQAASVSVDYTAKCSTKTIGEACGRFFHLLPFDGYSEASLEGGSVALLPKFSAGNLYIGLVGLTPPQPLTLLFQMAGASAAGCRKDPPQVTWSYLGRSGWTALQPSQILFDGTNGLQNSGILTFDLPSFGPDASTIADPDGQWLRASVDDDPSSFPHTSNIIPHALLATWQDNGSSEHFSAPLPAGTIKNPVKTLPAVATIAQPMESFGGRPPETGRSLQTWLGERLRHKDRGILAWDYERLVLEQFPAVWKVQALAARNCEGAAPGNVLLVVVPGPSSTEVMDPTAPMASADLLGRIKASLETCIGPFVTLHVANPIYVRITVTAEVLFTGDDDAGADIRRLNQELMQYLSPWPYDSARAGKGGDYASKDEILEFIQTRPYVDAIVSLGFGYDPQPASLDWYFLTSAKQHDISASNSGIAQPQKHRRVLSMPATT